MLSAFLIVSLLILLLSLFFAGSAIAGTADSARLAVHRKDPTGKTVTICSTYSPNASGTVCDEYVSFGPAPGGSLIYLVVGHGPTVGVNGVSFGIDYDGRSGERTGIDPEFVDFFPCRDGLSFYNDGGFGDFPAPKGGARFTWITCQTEQVSWGGVHAIIGALFVYAYSPDLLRLTPNNNLPSGSELNVATCDGGETRLLEVFPLAAHPYLTGVVALGVRLNWGRTGCEDFSVPSREETWGRVKALYGGSSR